MTETIQQSLSVKAARTLTTTTKTIPQLASITPRWLLRLLPWTDLESGFLRVNRCLSFVLGDGRIDTYFTGEQARVIPEELRELPFLRGVEEERLAGIADLFVQETAEPGQVLLSPGTRPDRLWIIAHGKAEKRASGPYGQDAVLALLTAGDHFDAGAWLRGTEVPYGVTALTSCVLLGIERDRLLDLAGQDAELLRAVEEFRAAPSTDGGGAPSEVAAGHQGEPPLPQTFVDYEENPREYEIQIAQTILRVHSRVSDVFNSPMDQLEQQLRLTAESVRERQEYEILNNPGFGLLHNVPPGQRVTTRSGPPGPDDLDELLTRVWKKPAFFLAHPRAIAAFGRECTRRGVPPVILEAFGSSFLTWRGVPLFPTDKIPLEGEHGERTRILLLRVGEEEQGVIGLRPAKLPHQKEPGLSVTPMGTDGKGIASHLVTAYFSTAVLVDDALAVLDDVEVGVYHDLR